MKLEEDLKIFNIMQELERSKYIVLLADCSSKNNCPHLLYNISQVGWDVLLGLFYPSIIFFNA